MNLNGIANLALGPHTGRWFRAFQPRFLPTALQTAHTRAIVSRFSPGPHSPSPFEILYLGENHQVALFEVGALYGNPLMPGGIVPHPSSSWTVASVRVNLGSVLDLTQATAQSMLGTTAQELTGDWQGYRSRSPATTVSGPVGLAPTQDLGQALNIDTRPIEGFISLSARLPYNQILMVFPQNLQTGGFVQFDYVDAAGVPQTSVVKP